MKKILCFESYPNYHSRSILNKIKKRFWIESFCFYDVPKHRKGSEWKDLHFKTTRIYSIRSRFLNIYRGIKSSDYVLIYGLFHPFPSMLLVLFLSKITKRNVLIASEGLKNTTGFKYRMIKFMIGCIFSNANFSFLCIGTNSNSDFYNLGFKRSKFLKYGFSEEYGSRKRKYTEESKNNSVFNVAVIGSLIERKGHKFLLSQMDHLKPNVSVKFNFYGEGELYKELLELSLNLNNNVSVHFHGHLSKDKLELELQSNDFVCVPSKYEGWGVIVNNALAFSLPVLCLDSVRSGKDFLVINDYNGYCTDEVSFISRFNELLDRGNLSRLSANSDFLYKKWSVDEIAFHFQKYLLNEEINSDPLGPLSIYKLSEPI
ncbi:glycosyltransferase [Vibrio breoganii]